jgi:hypothetical protein
MLDVQVSFSGVITNDGLIIKMPKRLPSSANTLDIVRPGNALDKFVLVLVLSRGVITEFVEEVLSSLES